MGAIYIDIDIVGLGRNSRRSSWKDEGKTRCEWGGEVGMCVAAAWLTRSNRLLVDFNF